MALYCQNKEQLKSGFHRKTRRTRKDESQGRSRRCIRRYASLIYDYPELRLAEKGTMVIEHAVFEDGKQLSPIMRSRACSIPLT